jgi:hypothetical protein
VELPPDFLSSGIQEQVDALALILRDLPSAPADPTRTGGLAEEDFLAGFGAVRPAIEALFARAEDAGWALQIGSAEATLRPREGYGLVVVYVSAVYGGGPQLRIWCASEALLRRVTDAVKIEGLSAHPRINAESVKFLIEPTTSVSQLVPLLGSVVADGEPNSP